MTDAAIQADGISFAYEDLMAVKDVSFSVAQGEIMGLLGPNGAGKSTTIKMLTGQAPPWSGTVKVLGMDVVSDRQAVQGRIGVCFEQQNLYLEMSGRDNLTFFSRLYGKKPFDPDTLLERVNLADRGGERVKGYSKGMRQRLMFARALINEPDVLFLDEPSGGLDPVSSIEIRRLIREEADRGAAVLLSTHDMHEADELSDRLAFIHEGQIVGLDTPEKLKLQYGERAVKVRTRSGDSVDETTLPLGTAESADELKSLVGSAEVLTIHTEEATLEHVFVQLTGRGLS